jgi:hypothetical protein
MTTNKRKSKKWSISDIRKIKAFIKAAEEVGLTRSHGINRAAEYFGVTRNAVVIRLGRTERNQKVSLLDRPTVKVPVERKQVVKEETAKNVLSLDIKDIKVDLSTKKIIIVY